MNDILRNNGERLTLTFKEEFKLNSAITDSKKRCRCGHTQLVIKQHDKEYILCTWCQGRLYHDDEKQQAYERARDRSNFLYTMRKVMESEKGKTIS